MNATTALSRKDFIKTLAISTAFSAIGTNGWTDLVASEIEASASTLGVLRVRISDFPALQANSGSVRFAINPVTGNSGPNGTFYPVTVNKGPNNTFFAMSSRCMHQGCIVEKMNTNNSLMTCLCHSSIYAIDGTRVSGPTPGNLTKYTFTLDGTGNLAIQVPGLAYSLKVAAVQPVTTGTQRLQLTFTAFRNVTYEVQYRETLSSPATVVPFATTATGPATLTLFKPTTASTQNFFVDSGTLAGFYTVAIRVATV